MLWFTVNEDWLRVWRRTEMIMWVNVSNPCHFGPPEVSWQKDRFDGVWSFLILAHLCCPGKWAINSHVWVYSVLRYKEPDNSEPGSFQCGLQCWLDIGKRIQSVKYTTSALSNSFLVDQLTDLCKSVKWLIKRYVCGRVVLEWVFAL